MSQGDEAPGGRLPAMRFEPLAGIRVVDLTSSVAGPTCTELLASLGADVVKIENPIYGDDSRTWGPLFWQDATPIFFSVNSSKRSLALDLKSEAGREAVLRLVDRADVVIQSLRPGTAERLGFGAEALRERNERLVYCSISGWGTEGPRAKQPAYDPMLQSFTGIVSVTGEPGREGQRVGLALIDTGTGMWAGLAIVAALLERTQTGRGRTIDAALFDTALGYLDYLYTDFLGTGRVPEPTGTQSPLIAPNQTFATQDGRLMVCALNDRLFARLCERLELPELVEDERFRDEPRPARAPRRPRTDARGALRRAPDRVLARRVGGHPRRAGAGRPDRRDRRACARERDAARARRHHDGADAVSHRRRAPAAPLPAAAARRAHGRGAGGARLLR